MEKTVRFGLLLYPAERRVLETLAEINGGLSLAATLRRLIRKEAGQCGFWPPGRESARQRPEGCRHTATNIEADPSLQSYGTWSQHEQEVQHDKTY